MTVDVDGQSVDAFVYVMTEGHRLGMPSKRYVDTICLYKCGNERYNLAVHAPSYKEKLFGKAGGR